MTRRKAQYHEAASAIHRSVNEELLEAMRKRDGEKKKVGSRYLSELREREGRHERGVKVSFGGF